MPDVSSEWPPYITGQRDHFHALGVIAATFNELEHRLLGIFLLYVGGFNDVTAMIFQRTRDNGTRIDWLKRAARINGETEEIKDAVEYFCNGFTRCAENRNILMHSGTAPETEGDEITRIIFTKAKKDQFEWNRFFVTLERLREIADSNYDFAEYANDIFLHVVANHRFEELSGPFKLPPASGSLPEKPYLPETLSPQPLLNPTTD